MTRNAWDHDTSTHYGPGGAQPPAFIAFRGRHELPHQPQQVRRDLMGEHIDRGDVDRLGWRWYEVDEATRRRLNCPYPFVVQTVYASAVTAFYTSGDFADWLDAYGLKTEGGRIVRSEQPRRPLWIQSRADLSIIVVEEAAP